MSDYITEGENLQQPEINATPLTTFRQKLENLPDEILNQSRFFEVGADKIPHVKDWSNPANQKLPAQVSGFAGFDISGHDLADDYLLIDFDHILDGNGNFVNADAQKCFEFCAAANSFSELSISKAGAHFIFKPTPGKFPPTANGKNGVLDLGDGAKIELFYKTKGRYCLLTGDVRYCQPKAPVVAGDAADDVFKTLLEEIAKRLPKPAKSTPARATEKKAQAAQIDSPDYELFRAALMLDAINPADLEDSDWLAVMSACKNIGVPYNVVDSFNQRDPDRYNETENQTRWNSLDDSSFDIATLHGIAKRFAYDEKDARRQWYQLPPAFDTKHLSAAQKAEQGAQDAMSRREELFAKLKELQKPPMSKDKISKIRGILHKLCHWAHDKNGTPTKIKPDVYNYKLIFDNDPNLKNLFGRDDFRQETIFLRRAVWHNEDAPLKDSWDDADDAEIRLYLAENYAEMSNPQRTFDFIIRVARENSFHSIKKFFDGLPEWDGVPRMETLFVKFLGADDTEYTHEVTRHCLLGAIARAFYPGCDFQSVVVLQGPQGIGKSRVVRMLGGKHGVNKGENWHVALRDQLDDSHAVDAMRKGWIVEIEEFAAGSRADVNAMKGVLSADDVTRRFAYDRRAKTIKAHWTFFATCNDDAPLRDQTGNRRFLPIKCHNKQSQIIEGMTADYIQQVWAEALVEFNKLFPTVDDFDDDKLRLSPEIQAQAAAQAENITQDDGLTTEIKGYLDKKILPPVIWYLLSREERRKFFVDGGKIQIEQGDLQARFKNRVGKKYDELLPEFETACKVREGFLRHFTDKDERWQFVFYGAEYRRHICAAEVFNECFGSDNRKRINRINEILSMLDGWHLGERLQNADPTYKDQKKAYYRDKDNYPVEESIKIEPAQSPPTTFDPDDTPF